jgi:hypothetical protein
VVREQTEDLHNEEEELIEIEDSDAEEILEEEAVEDGRVSTTPARRTLNLALYSIVIVAIVAFTYLLVTTLMQHPRVYDDGTLFIHKTIVTGALGLVAPHLLWS